MKACGAREAKMLSRFMRKIASATTLLHAPHVSLPDATASCFTGSAGHALTISVQTCERDAACPISTG